MRNKVMLYLKWFQQQINKTSDVLGLITQKSCYGKFMSLTRQNKKYNNNSQDTKIFLK